MNQICCLRRRENFFPVHFMKSKNYSCIFPQRQFMIYIVGTPLVDPSIREVLKLVKNNTYNSL